jgi:hypothetical protein
MECVEEPVFALMKTAYTPRRDLVTADGEAVLAC